MSDQASSQEGEEEYLKDFEVIRAVSNTETFSPRSEKTAKSFGNKKGTVRDVSKRLGTL